MEIRQKELRVDQAIEKLLHDLRTTDETSVYARSAETSLAVLVKASALYCSEEGKKTDDLEDGTDDRLVRLHGALDSLKIGPRRFEY